MSRMNNDGYNAYQLKAFASSDTLVTLYMDPENPDDYIDCFVSAVNGRQALVDVVSQFGRYDGHMVLRLPDINMVLGEDGYSVRLKHVLKLRGQPRPLPIPCAADEDLVHALCRAAMERGRVITLFTADDERAGFVERLDDMRVTLRELDFYGQPAGEATLVLRDVEMATMDAEEDLMLMLMSASEL
ncbi:MAG: hypothetical protein GX558_01390 [Clostridiales bacterium]|nr:hypothetical protein [Clostridiales bacterium]